MEQALNATRASGIVVVVSAGNAGPNCSSFPGPAGFFDKAFSIGATQSNDTIAGFSSRGPVTNDGSNRRKPNVSAPGVGVLSTFPNGNFGVFSGTSMAGPHVVGAVALMISANPQLAGQVDTIERILELTCRPMQTTQNCGTISGLSIPNNTYGWGRINALEAVKKGLLYKRPTTKTIENQTFIKVSPNPFSSEISINTEGVTGETKVIIFNINGQVIVERSSMFVPSNTLTISLPNMPNGIYFYKIYNKNVTFVGKIVKI